MKLVDLKVNKLSSKLSDMANKTELQNLVLGQIPNGTLTPQKTSFVSYSSNLFNRNNVSNGTLDYTTGVINASSDYVTDYIPIDANMYICSYPSGNISFYDSNKNFISGVTNTLFTTNRKSPANTAYFRFSTTASNYNWTDSTTGARLQINASSVTFATLPLYEDFCLKFNNKKLLTESDKGIYTGKLKTIVNVNQETISIGTNASKNDDVACIAIGTSALSSIQRPDSGDDGCFNTAIGHNTLKSATLADHNTAVGWSAMTDNITGDGNTAVGEDALCHNTIGNSNVAIGNRAMQSATGDKNTAVGSTAMYYGSNVPTGTGNSALGYGAGSDNGAGNYNVAIGYWTKNGVDFNNSVAIGNNVNNTKSNQVMIGNAETIENVFHGNLVLYDANGIAYKIYVGTDGILKVAVNS